MYRGVCRSLRLTSSILKRSRALALGGWSVVAKIEHETRARLQPRLHQLKLLGVQWHNP